MYDSNVKRSRRIYQLIIRRSHRLGRSHRAYRLLNLDLSKLDGPSLANHFEENRVRERRPASLLLVSLLVARSPIRALRFDAAAYGVQNLDVAYTFETSQYRSHFILEGQFDSPRRRTAWQKSTRSELTQMATLLSASRQNLLKGAPQTEASTSPARSRVTGEVQASIAEDDRRMILKALNSFQANPLHGLIGLHDAAGCARPFYDDCFLLTKRIAKRAVNFAEIIEWLTLSAQQSKIARAVSFSGQVSVASLGNQRDPMSLANPIFQQGSKVAPTVWSVPLAERMLGLGDYRKERVAEIHGCPGIRSGSLDDLQPISGGNAQRHHSLGVIISLYRSELYIKSLVEQINALSLEPNDKIWIGLCEPSELELAALSTIEKSVVLHEYPRREGIYKVWNDGAISLDVDYLTNMNADDYRPPNSIELQHRAIKSYPEADVIYSPYGVIEDLESSTSWLSPSRVVSPLEVSVRSVLNGYNPPHNAPLWRRSLHQELGLFREDLNSASDADFWVRALMNGKKFACFGVPWSGYFDNPSGLSTRQQSPVPRAVREHHQLLCEVYGSLTKAGFTSAIKTLIDIASTEQDLSIDAYDWVFETDGGSK